MPRKKCVSKPMPLKWPPGTWDLGFRVFITWEFWGGPFSRIWKLEALYLPSRLDAVFALLVALEV